MRIISLFVISCSLVSLVQSVEEHRSSNKKKEKRQLDYSLSLPYSGGPNFRSERRINHNGLQHLPQYPSPQYYPGPPRPYRKDPVQEQTESVDRGGSGDTIYIPHKPLIKVVEKPVYIKEPEPIIEIIIKESNISLPPPPTEAPPPPQKKKKEEVQVFYVKYKKNPHGHGKDAVIYDKPIPAISPPIPDDPEPEDQWNEPQSGNYGSYSNQVTEPPKPSTTLRTIIKPDSEVYHSPGNNIKVTFGKEGFDYGKRSSKPEDYPIQRDEDHGPRARQLSSFSDVYFKRPANSYVTSSSNEYRSEVRAPQPYRPFANFPPSSNQFNSRPPNREFNSRPPPFFPPSSSNKYPFQHPPYTKPSSSQPAPPHSSRNSFPSFSHSISHPPPPHFQAKPNFPPSSPSRYPPQFQDIPPPNQRQPVPYTPFENIRPSPPPFSQPLPVHDHHQSFGQPTQPPAHHQTNIGQNIQFRPETRFNTPQHLPVQQQPSLAEVNNQFKSINQQQSQQPSFQQQIHNQPTNNNEYREHLDNIRTAQRIIPPGGELLQSLPKFEQHLVVDPSTGQLTQVQNQPRFKSEQTQHEGVNRANKQAKNQSPGHYVNTQSNVASLRHQANHNQIFDNSRFAGHNTQSPYSSTTPKPSTTTTNEPEKPSTTTKDPKVLEAQLPDEVPDDLRQQLLSSGILNNADISILDYDKVGDIPLSALPPDQLANFYGAGGAQQIAEAGSELHPQVAALTSRTDGSPVVSQDQELSAEESEVSEVAVKPKETGVEMKVVKYNPETDKGQQVQEAYISESAQKVDPVVLNDNTYNRYLPLKINGTQFPIPDVPELKGKLISSVVVLAPISYDFSSSRQTRETSPADDLHLIQNEPLKKLLVNPTRENYRKFLENEGKTNVAKQAVVLLVTGPNQNSKEGKEIYMYDIISKTVSKLSGELSSAFVDAAEANSADTSKTS